MLPKPKKIIEKVPSHQSAYRKAKRSAKQLFSFDFDKDIERKIILQIQKSEGTFVARLSNSKTIWKVTITGQELTLIFSRSKQRIEEFVDPASLNGSPN